MRRKIAAANWKMNLTLEEGKALTQQIVDAGLRLSADQEVILCVPMPYLSEIKKMVRNYPHIYVGAQNLADHASGAYTGETSAAMLQSVGTDYVLIGHSERRSYYGETNQILKEKMALALAQGLKPIFCCGEPLEVREKEQQNAFVQQQLTESLFGTSAADLKTVVIAYEPIWAIGTGRTASPQQAEEMHAFIRAQIAAQYGNEAAIHTTILYGGSCKPENAAELFTCPDVDGALIGGASLKADSFVAITESL